MDSMEQIEKVQTSPSLKILQQTCIHSNSMLSYKIKL